ncbi:MAG TPA: glycosyltransferase [Terriglobia bacterium]|nr:glycosyltransferase [Terriglobia bacterium]
MIRIVHLITGLNVGGAERSLAGLLHASDQRRFSHLVISMIRPGPVADDLAHAGIEVRSLEMNRGRPSLCGAARLVRMLRRLRPQLLHCWMYHANLLGVLAGKAAGVPRIIWGIRSSDRDLSSDSALTRWVVALGGLFSSFADLITVNSEVGRRVHENWGYSGSRMTVIHNGVDLDRFKPDQAARRSVRAELGLSPDAPIVGLIARYHPMKDHSTFFQAARLLLRRNQRVHFLLCGNEVTPQNPGLAKRSAHEGFGSHVHLLGLRHDVSRLTAALDIATSCSVYGEGFSNALAEAMACGVPCVATPVGDSPEIVGDTGRLVRCGDPDALAAAWKSILNLSNAERSEMSLRCRQRIVHHFAMQRTVAAYEALYDRLSVTSRSCQQRRSKPRPLKSA